MTGSVSGNGWEHGREVVIKKIVIKKLSLLLLIWPPQKLAEHILFCSFQLSLPLHIKPPPPPAALPLPPLSSPNPSSTSQSHSPLKEQRKSACQSLNYTMAEKAPHTEPQPAAFTLCTSLSAGILKAF